VKSHDYKIGIYSFFPMHATAKRKNKEWLDRNSDSVSEWSDVSTEVSAERQLPLLVE
jgi:hypothetical protein